MVESPAPPGLALSAALVSQGFALRPEDERDLPFLMRLYATTREQELAPLPWTPEQKQLFLASQFQAQRHHYRTYFGTSAFDLLEQNGEPCGRLYVQRRETTLHIIDIALLPAWRGNGIGTALLEALKAQARTAGIGISNMVERYNPALRLYLRLGFAEIADHGIYLELEWRPNDAQLNVA